MCSMMLMLMLMLKRWNAAARGIVGEYVLIWQDWVRPKIEVKE